VGAVFYCVAVKPPAKYEAYPHREFPRPEIDAAA